MTEKTFGMEDQTRSYDTIVVSRAEILMTMRGETWARNEGSNLERIALAVIRHRWHHPPSFLRGRPQSATHMCVNRDADHASQISLSMNARTISRGGGEKSHRHNRHVSVEKRKKKHSRRFRMAICFTVARRYRRSNGMARPRASIVPSLGDCVIHGREKKRCSGMRVERRGFITRAVFHSAVLSTRTRRPVGRRNDRR